MKFLLVVVGLFVAAAAGAAGALLFAPAPPRSTAAVEPARLEPAPAAALSPQAEKQVVELAMQVAHLEAEVRALRAAAARAPVAAEASAPAAAAGAIPVVAVQREQILQVLADEKAAEERRREEERARREEEALVQRANRQAQRFGLNQAEERQLADFYRRSGARIDELRESMRQARESGSLDGEQMRSAFRDARDWANGELERLFGPELGKQIGESEMDRFRGGFGGGFEGGAGARPGRRGGQGGGGQGGGGQPGGAPGG